MNRHNYALLFWPDYFLSSGSRPMVVHVDRHEDLAESGQSVERGRVNDIEYVANYIDRIDVKGFERYTAFSGENVLQKAFLTFCHFNVAYELEF